MICGYPKCGETAFYELDVTHCQDEDGSDAITVAFCERHYQKAKRHRC